MAKANCKRSKKATAKKALPPSPTEVELAGLREENRRLRAALYAVASVAEQKTSYYYNLVWRSDKMPDDIPSDFYTRLQGRPDHEQYLRDEKNIVPQPDDDETTKVSRSYHKGFHAGCYASAQLFLGLAVVNDDVMCCHLTTEPCTEECVWTAAAMRQQALDLFPLLDT